MCSESFSSIGLSKLICDYCQYRDWKEPTTIQKNAIPRVLIKSDVVGISETGSGKTAAYLLPMFDLWLQSNRPKFFFLIVSPTRELTKQILFEIQQFSEFLSSKSEGSFDPICLIGGEDMVDQTIDIAYNKHHAIISTPGRLVDHIDKNSRFSQSYLSQIKIIVLDEADQMLNLQFQDSLDKILSFYEKPLSKKKLKRENHKRLLDKQIVNSNEDKRKIGKNYSDLFPHPQTLLFSATMTKRIDKLKRACISFANVAYVSGIVMNDKLKEDETSNGTELTKSLVSDLKMVGIPANLHQYYIPCEILDKNVAIDYIIEEFVQKKGNYMNIVVFCNRISEVFRLSAFLRQKYADVVVHLTGKTKQAERSRAVDVFRENLFRESPSILVATDVAGRGLDFPNIGLVINYEVPTNEKSYKHRIGRTARANSEGIALTLVTKNVAINFLDLEASLSRIMPKDWRMAQWPNWQEFLGNKKAFKKRRQICNSIWQKANKEIREKEKELLMLRKEIKLNDGCIVDVDEKLNAPNIGLDKYNSDSSEEEIDDEELYKDNPDDENEVCVGVVEAQRKYKQMRREILEIKNKQSKIMIENEIDTQNQSDDERMTLESNIPKKIARLISN